jgi:hypothetical protein
MNLPKTLFWDVDYDSLDFEKYASWVIVRVFERGDVEDIRAVRRHYGDEKVREALTKAKFLPLKTIHLACAVLDNELMDYRCYREAQSNPQHWNY